MRSYKEIADRVLERRDEYLAEKKKKRAALIRGFTAAAGTGLMIMVGIGLWQNSDIRKAAPSQHENQYIITEYTTEDTSDTTSPEVTGTDIVTSLTEPTSESVVSPTDSSKDETVTTTTSSSVTTTVSASNETGVPTSTSTSTGTSPGSTSASGTSSNVRTTTSAVTTGRSTATTTHTTRRTTSASTTTTKQTTTAATTTSPRTSPTTTQHQTTTTRSSTQPYNTTTITQTTTKYYTYATSTQWFTTTTTVTTTRYATTTSVATSMWHTTTTTTTSLTTIWYTSTMATSVTTPPDEIYTWFYYDGYMYDIEDHYEMVNSALDVAAPIGHVDPDVRPDPYTGLLAPNSIDVYKIPNVDPYYAIAIKFTENWEHRGHLLAYRNSYRIGEPPDTFNDLIDGLGLTTEAAGFTATLEDGTSKYYDKYKLQQILEIIQNAEKIYEYIWDCPLIISISTRYTKSPIIIRIDEEHLYIQAFSGYAFSITPEQYQQILVVINST